MAAISSTAARNEASFAFDGLLYPLIFLTNWSEAARISSSVVGGSKLKRVLIFMHIALQSNVSKPSSFQAFLARLATVNKPNSPIAVRPNKPGSGTPAGDPSRANASKSAWVMPKEVDGAETSIRKAWPS